MKRFLLDLEPLSPAQVRRLLAERGIGVNRYAEEYLAHPCFPFRQAGEITVVITSLREIGLEDGATLDEVFQRLPDLGLESCPPATGLFLRLAWTDQPKSRNSVLSGTHQAPEGAVTVLSELLEQDDAFPKGLYLRNVDDRLWLRGYVCDSSYRFPGEALFAFASPEDERTAHGTYPPSDKT